MGVTEGVSNTARLSLNGLAGIGSGPGCVTAFAYTCLHGFASFASRTQPMLPCILRQYYANHGI